MTKKELKLELIQEIQEVWFVAAYNRENGHTDVADNMMQQAIGILNFARSLGYDCQEIGKEAAVIFNERKFGLPQEKAREALGI